MNFFLITGFVTGALSVFLLSSQTTETTLPDEMIAANVEALSHDEGAGGLVCNYSVDAKQCSITVSAEVAAKLLGIPASGGGLVNLHIDGAQECISGGNSTCTPVQCSELYQHLFK